MLARLTQYCCLRVDVAGPDRIEKSWFLELDLNSMSGIILHRFPAVLAADQRPTHHTDTYPLSHRF